MSNVPPPPPPPPPGAMPPPPPAYGAGGSSSYSIGDAFSYGWNKFRQYLGPILILVLLVAVAVAVGQGISLLVQSNSGGFGGVVLSLIVSLAVTILSFALQYGIVRASLAITRGEEPTVANAWDMAQFGPYIVATILQSLLIFVGLILCVIPGIVLAFLTIFTPYFVIDQNMAPVDAIKASINLVTKNAGTLILFILLAFVVYFLGALVCLIGLLVSIPVVLIATAYTYRKMTNQSVAA